MSKPDDISQDVWDEAEQHFDDFLRYEQGTYRPAVQIIARAILSERTKAAEIAWLQSKQGATHEQISQAIRKGGKE